jgi:hypothetical protein
VALHLAALASPPTVLRTVVDRDRRNADCVEDPLLSSGETMNRSEPHRMTDAQWVEQALARPPEAWIITVCFDAVIDGRDVVTVELDSVVSEGFDFSLKYSIDARALRRVGAVTLTVRNQEGFDIQIVEGGEALRVFERLHGAATDQQPEDPLRLPPLPEA